MTNKREKWSVECFWMFLWSSEVSELLILYSVTSAAIECLPLICWLLLQKVQSNNPKTLSLACLLVQMTAELHDELLKLKWRKEAERRGIPCFGGGKMKAEESQQCHLCWRGKAKQGSKRWRISLEERSPSRDTEHILLAAHNQIAHSVSNTWD